MNRFASGLGAVFLGAALALGSGSLEAEVVSANTVILAEGRSLQQYQKDLEILTRFYHAKAEKTKLFDGDIVVLTREAYIELLKLGARADKIMEKYKKQISEGLERAKTFMRQWNEALEKNDPQSESYEKKAADEIINLYKLNDARELDLSPLRHLAAKLPHLAILKIRDGKLTILDYEKSFSERDISRELVEVLTERYPGQYGLPTK